MPAIDYYKDLLERGKEEIMGNCNCCDGEHPDTGGGAYVSENGILRKLNDSEISPVEHPTHELVVPKEFEQACLGSIEPGHEE